MGKQHAGLAARLDALRPGADGDRDPEFTERELEVIVMLPSQLTTREIGEELFLSRNTIKTYLRRVYRKPTASSLEEAVLVANELGLLSDQTM
jgi:LuxR family maltose regulon positive regulatory protein